VTGTPFLQSFQSSRLIFDDVGYGSWNVRFVARLFPSRFPVYSVRDLHRG
jgi:hypothetical protein